MSQTPHNPFNFEFDEKFMDAVVRRAGGKRLDEDHRVPQGVENVDYLIGEHALELKTLEVEPLDHPNRQIRMRKNVSKEKGLGTPGIHIDPATQRLELTGEAERKFWQFELGNTVHEGMKKAASQIADTRKFLGKPLRGAVLIMNAKSLLNDGNSLIKLLELYRSEFPELDVCLGYTAVIASVDGAKGQTFGSAAGPLPHPRDAALHDTLHRAIREEIAARGYPSTHADATGATLEPLQSVVEMPASPGLPPLRMHPRPGVIGQIPDFSKRIGKWWEIAHGVSEAAKSPETLNCHYLPQFLMRRWARDDGKIRYVEIATGEEHLGKPEEIAALPDLYTTSAPDSPPDRRLLEAFFNCTESDATAVLAKLEANKWVITDKQKEVLSIFLAALVVRLPSVIAKIMEQYRPDWKREWGLEPDGTPHRGNFILRLLKNEQPFTPSGPILQNLATCFFHRHKWTFALLASDQRMPTGDVPIMLNFGNDALPPDKWEIRIPLGPGVLLTTNNNDDAGNPYPVGVQQADPKYRPAWAARDMKYRLL
jgi:hypothetical protein